MAITGEANRARIGELHRLLDPRRTHDEAVAELDEMFAGGRSPAADIGGFHRGRLLTTSFGSPFDPIVRRVSGLWMPWLGKRLAPETHTGVNVLTPSARGRVKMLWPSYEPVSTAPDGIEVFEFQTRLAPGELDPGVDVLKIDYDWDRNPEFVIRHILDELVEVDEGFFLGKILFRFRGAHRRIGFFSLEAPRQS